VEPAGELLVDLDSEQAAAAEVAVSGRNKIKVHRIVGATDPGYAVNPAQIERQVGEEDKLFGSVTTRDIEAALQEKGVTIDHRKVHMPDPIKTIGYHTVEIKLGTGVTGKIKVPGGPAGIRTVEK